MSTQIQNSKDLGRLVRETRKRLKLTQPQVALVANVGVRFIVELEAGKATLRLENILRVLQALGGVLSVDGMDSTCTSLGPSFDFSGNGLYEGIAKPFSSKTPSNKGELK